MAHALRIALVLLLVLCGADVGADGPPAPARAKVLIPVLGAKPAGGAEGATSHEPPPPPGTVPPDTHPDGLIGQAAGERAGQLQDEGYDVEVRYFSTLQAFLCWLLKQLKEGKHDVYRHVEMYGHGAPAGPEAGFPEALTEQQLLARWELLAELLRRIMTKLAGANGRIVFGWCRSGGPSLGSTGGPLAGGKYPGGVVAGKAGHPVYGPKGLIDFPYEPALPLPSGRPFGGPFSEPSPTAGEPGTGAAPGHPGWWRFPPLILPDPEAPVGTPLIPNDGRFGPEEVLPGPDRGRLPYGPGETPTDPHAGRTTPPATSPLDDDGPVVPPPAPPPPMPSDADAGCE